MAILSKVDVFLQMNCMPIIGTYYSYTILKKIINNDNDVITSTAVIENKHCNVTCEELEFCILILPEEKFIITFKV